MLLDALIWRCRTIDSRGQLFVVVKGPYSFGKVVVKGVRFHIAVAVLYKFATRVGQSKRMPQARCLPKMSAGISGSD